MGRTEITQVGKIGSMMVLRRALIGAGLLAAALAMPAQAQFSAGYKFLQDVREKKGTEVTAVLAEPGTTIVNTRDGSTGETALHIVTNRRDLTWMTFLIDRGANVNLRDARGATPLVAATNLSFVEGVQLLITKGARVDEPNSTGETPLIGAVHRRSLALMRALLVAGADPDRNDNSGRSARDYARLEGANSAFVSEINTSARAKAARGAARSYGPSL